MPENDGRNALAELAEFLKEESKCYSKSEEFKTRAIAAFGEDSWKRYLAKKNKILMASRIVAELAKVKYKFIGDNLVERDFDGLENSFLNCRAIAEEGVSNGK